MTTHEREQVTREKANTPDVTPEEAIERVMATNDHFLFANQKLLFDEAIAHKKVTDGYSQIALANAITNSDAMMKQHMRHQDVLFSHSVENNRYTLNALYGFSPEEMSALVPVLEQILKYTKTD